MSWWALMTAPQSEFKAEHSISRMGVNAQCPIVVERRIRQRRSATIKQEVCKPLFPSYIFVELGYLPAWIFQEKHIIRPLASPIPDDLMLNALASSGQITLDEWRKVTRFAKGDTVKRKGDNSGLTGIVLSAVEEKLIVLFNLLGESKLRFHQDEVEAA